MTRRYNLSHAAGQPMPEDWIHLPDSVVAAADYDALAARLAEAERDAARYRWLRDSAGNDIMEKLMAECSPPRWDELVDAAIDAAMGEKP